MTALDEPEWLNVDLLKTHVAEAQTDLILVADYLAHAREPRIDNDLIWAISILHLRLARFAPTHCRH